MVFSSLTFIFIFLPLLLVLYYIVPSKKTFLYKNIILLIFSLIFYSWGEGIYVLLMLFSSVVDYTIGIFLTKYKSKKKIFLILSIVVNLGLLFVFKYSNFFIENVNNIFNLDIGLLDLSLPIGISFFTFQTMSYSIDVYLGKVKCEKNFLNFFLYVSMFPQLIAGPIVRYELVNKELRKREIAFSGVADGFMIFLMGLFKKVLIANNMGIIWDQIKVLDGSQLSLVLSWLGIVFFALQIYFDFSGYSDMALGLGKMLGFTYPKNFDYPYIAKSITDFWRRWHITLSSFFKDYVYIPLGGNKCKVSRNIVNLLIVWGLTGFWHGAEWNYVIWGLYFGVVLICEKYLLNKVLEKIPNILKRLYAIILILIGWLIFVSNEIVFLNDYLSSLIGSMGFINNNALGLLYSNFTMLVIGIVLSLPVYPYLKDKYMNINNKGIKAVLDILIFVSVVILFILTISYLVSNSYNPFLYFRF